MEQRRNDTRVDTRSRMEGTFCHANHAVNVQPERHRRVATNLPHLRFPRRRRFDVNPNSASHRLVESALFSTTAGEAADESNRGETAGYLRCTLMLVPSRPPLTHSACKCSVPTTAVVSLSHDFHPDEKLITAYHI